MATRPTDLPQWGQSAPASLYTEPTVAKRGAGFALKEVISAALLNGILGSIGKWFDYLLAEVEDERARIYPDAHTAIDATSSGAIVVLEEQLTGSGIGDDDGPFEQMWTASTDSGAVTDVCTDGRYVYCVHASGGGSTMRCFDRADGSLVWEDFLSSVDICAVDPDALYVVAGDELTQLARADGAVQSSFATSGTFDHGAAINDIDCDGAAVYLTGVSGTASTTGTTRCLNQLGVEQWVAAHGATCNAICVARQYVYAGGADAGGGVTLRRYNRVGGGSSVAYTPGGAISALASDGDWVYAAVASVGLVAFSAEAGFNAGRWTVSGLAGADRIAVDDRYVYAFTDGGTSTIDVLDKVTGTVLYDLSLTGVTEGAITSDGSQFYYSNGTGGVIARRLPMAIRHWLRSSGTAHDTPFHQLLLPLSP